MEFENISMLPVGRHKKEKQQQQQQKPDKIENKK